MDRPFFWIERGDSDAIENHVHITLWFLVVGIFELMRGKAEG